MTALRTLGSGAAIAQPRYGSLPAPEEKPAVDVKLNLVEAVSAMYSLWKSTTCIADSNVWRKRWGTWSRLYLSENYYAEAARIVKPFAGVFANADAKAVEGIAGIVGGESYDGIFLSALLNETGLPFLAGVFDTHELGTRLAKGKILVAYPGSSVSRFGAECEGIIVSYGKSGIFSAQAKSGVQVSFGDTGLLGHSSSGGVQVCYGTEDSTGALYFVLLSSISYFPELRTGRMPKKGNTIALHISAGLDRWLHEGEDYYGLQGPDRITQFRELATAFEHRANDVAFMGGLSMPSDLGKILSYDWAAYERDVSYMALKMREALQK